MNLAHPAWLIALILLPLIAVLAVIASRRQQGKWASLVADRLRETLIRRSSPIPRWLSLAFMLGACALIIGGLARPQGEGDTKTEKSVGRNLLIALDLSRSMRVQDTQPDRLANAKLVIYELIDALPSERIGLIGFAGSPYLYAPLTIDHNAVRETVEQMDETWPTVGGSDLGAAIRLGTKTLRKTGQRNNAMVIISDGEKHKGDTEQMIAEALEAGVYIITVGVGTEDGGFVPHPDFPNQRMLQNDGSPVISRLQADQLRKLANGTNGSYAQAGSGADIPAMIKSAIAGLDAFEMDVRERKVSIEFYQWLIMPAILLLVVSLIAGTRWRGIGTVLLLFCFLGSHQQARADEVTEARKALIDGRHQEAMERYDLLAQHTRLESLKSRYRLGEATAAYRAGDYRRALQAYSLSLLSKDAKVRKNAHHGNGNCLFQLGWLKIDTEPYSVEADLVPVMDRFDELVLAKLATMKEANPQDDADNDLESMILMWTDAVRHHDSVLAIDPDHKSARHNREVIITYLNRLAELLKEDEQQTEQAMPEQLPSPDPQDGDSESGDDQQDPSGDPKPGDQNTPQGDPGNQGDKDPKQQQPGDQEQDPNQDPGQNNSDQQDESGEPFKPDETPEERARRLLGESADLENGPIQPGQIEFQRPLKDW